jgi:thiamine pyrophosphokinase
MFSPKIHLNEFLNLKATTRLNFISNYHLIMLNSRSMEVEIVTSLWNNFESKTCADGSANRLYDALSNDERLKYIPDFLVGDLDSVRPEVHSFYQ